MPESRTVTGGKLVLAAADLRQTYARVKDVQIDLQNTQLNRLLMQLVDVIDDIEAMGRIMRDTL